VLRRPVESALRPAIGVVNQTAAMDGAAVVDGLLEGVQHKAGMGGAAERIANHWPNSQIDDLMPRNFGR